MVHWWCSGKRAGVEGTSSAPEIGASGDIAVVGEKNNRTHELVPLAYLMAKRARCNVRLLHTTKVLHTGSLKASSTKACQMANSSRRSASR